MTLVVAFLAKSQNFEIPVIIGDSQLSYSDKDVLKSSGNCKKTIRLAGNLVIGWSGYLVTIKPVVEKLITYFKTEKATKISFDKIISSVTIPREQYRYRSKFIGWLIDGDRKYCFEWDSFNCNELEYIDDLYKCIGTGCGENEDSIDKYFKSFKIDANINPVAFIVSYLYEFIEEKSFFEKIGVSEVYSILHWNGEIFSYFSNCMYMCIDVAIKENQYHYEIKPPLIKHNHVNEIECITSYGLSGCNFKAITCLGYNYNYAEDCINQFSKSVKENSIITGLMELSTIVIFIKIIYPNGRYKIVTYLSDNKLIKNYLISLLSLKQMDLTAYLDFNKIEEISIRHKESLFIEVDGRVVSFGRN